MELLIALGIIVTVAAGWIFYKNRSFDINKDGKVDSNDVKPTAEQLVEAVAEVTKQAADVNKDGVVNIEDAKAVVKKPRTTVKKATTKKVEPATKATKATKAPAKPRKPKMTVVK